MKKCSSCGKEIGDDARFCEYCGAKQDTTQDEKISEEKSITNTSARSENKKYSIPIAMIGLLLIVSFVLIVNRDNTKFDLLDEVKSIGVGDTINLPVHLESSKYATDDIIWETSDAQVVTVEDGCLTGKAEGTAVITATLGRHHSECDVSVHKPLLKGIRSTSSFPNQLHMGESIQISQKEWLRPVPANADLGKIEWKSSNSNILKIQDDKIVILDKGSAILIMTAENGVSVTETITCVGYLPSKIEIKNDKTSLNVGETIQLETHLEPEESEDRLKYSATGAVRVDSNGKVTATKPGEGTVTVTTSNGKMDSIRFLVTRKSPITIKSVKYEIDFVGGVEFYFRVKNNTAKDIKYIDMSWICYNSVNDVIADEITGDTTFRLNYTGPLQAGKTSVEFYNMTKFYNVTFSGLMDFTNITVTYMDGTVENLDQDELMECDNFWP